MTFDQITRRHSPNPTGGPVDKPEPPAERKPCSVCYGLRTEPRYVGGFLVHMPCSRCVEPFAVRGDG